MPVIKADEAENPAANDNKKERRENLTDLLAREASGETSEGGPVIFEIPLGAPNKIDVLVVWDEWGPFTSEERSEIILEVYKQKASTIAQALGVTFQEALEDQLLPYFVTPMARQAEADPQRLKKEMIAEGGIRLKNDKVALRFPTKELARRAFRRLVDRMPDGYWSLGQTFPLEDAEEFL